MRFWRAGSWRILTLWCSGRAIVLAVARRHQNLSPLGGRFALEGRLRDLEAARRSAFRNGARSLEVRYETNDDGWVTAQLADVPEVVSRGEDEAQALQNLLDVLRDLLDPTLFDAPSV